MFSQPHPGSTYWQRGLEFIQQCELPLGSPQVATALAWRLAPALLAKALGLQHYNVLVIPWVGLVIMLMVATRLFWQRTNDLMLTGIAVALLGTCSATTAVTGWLGINDAWYAACLLLVALQPGVFWVMAAIVIGPWVDERFALSLPLAFYIRRLLLSEQGGLGLQLSLGAGSLLFYGLMRWLNPAQIASDNLSEYLHYAVQNCIQWLPWTGVGWFMGLRAAWALVALGIMGAGLWNNRQPCWLLGTLAIVPLVLITILASDTGRAPTMLVPLLAVGIESLVKTHGLPAARRVLSLLLLANLLMPAMHVTYKHADLINMLPFEIARCWPHN